MNNNLPDIFSSVLDTDKLTFNMNASEKGSITTTSSGIDLTGGAEKYGPQIGLIAQEVEQVIPEIVKTDPESGKKSVDYAKMVAVLIEAMRYMIGEEIEE